MPSTTVRISKDTRESLRKLADRVGEPMQSILDRAVEAYRRERFFDEMDAAYTALRGDPALWEEECEERRLWETTLEDGLDSDEEGGGANRGETA